MAGDESALPAMAQGVAFAEVADAAEEQPLDYAATIELNWPSGNIFVWIAGEAAAVSDTRHYARVERGLDRSGVDAVPYWKAGQNEEAYHAERHIVLKRACQRVMPNSYSIARCARRHAPNNHVASGGPPGMVNGFSNA